MPLSARDLALPGFEARNSMSALTRAKAVCSCAKCIKQRSLGQLLGDADSQSRVQATKLIAKVCKELLASSSAGVRLERDHSFFGHSHPLNECEGGLYLPVITKLCREVGLELTVFPSRHATLFESYFIALPHDEDELEQAKTRVAQLAASWHVASLGWSQKDFMDHIRGQDKACRQRLAEVRADAAAAADAQLVLEFVKEMSTHVPAAFKYIYAYDYELGAAVGRSNNPRYFGDLVLTNGCGVFMTVECRWVNRNLERYSGPTTPQGMRNASPQRRSSSPVRGLSPGRSRTLSTDAGVLARTSLAAGSLLLPLGDISRHMYLRTEIKDQGEKVAQMFALSHPDALAVLPATYTDEGFTLLKPAKARLFTQQAAPLTARSAAAPAAPRRPAPRKAAGGGRSVFRRLFGLALLTGAGAVGVQVARGELSMDDVKSAIQKAGDAALKGSAKGAKLPPPIAKSAARQPAPKAPAPKPARSGPDALTRVRDGSRRAVESLAAHPNVAAALGIVVAANALKLTAFRSRKPASSAGRLPARPLVATATALPATPARTSGKTPVRQRLTSVDSTTYREAEKAVPPPWRSPAAMATTPANGTSSLRRSASNGALLALGPRSPSSGSSLGGRNLLEAMNGSANKKANGTSAGRATSGRKSGSLVRRAAGAVTGLALLPVKLAVGVVCLPATLLQ